MTESFHGTTTNLFFILYFCFQTRVRGGSEGAEVEEGGGADPGRGQVQRLHVHTAGRVPEQQHRVHHEQEVSERGH